jgi:hypothetical protein
VYSMKSNCAAANRAKAAFHVLGRSTTGWLPSEPPNRTCRKADKGSKWRPRVLTTHPAVAMAEPQRLRIDLVADFSAQTPSRDSHRAVLRRSALG